MQSKKSTKESPSKSLRYIDEVDEDEVYCNTADDTLEIIQQMSLERFDNIERFKYD